MDFEYWVEIAKHDLSKWDSDPEWNSDAAFLGRHLMHFDAFDQWLPFMRLISLAKTDVVAYEALIAALRWCAATSTQVPPVLHGFVARVVDGRFTKPAGKLYGTHGGRDVALGFCACCLVSTSNGTLKTSRGRRKVGGQCCPKGGSACDAVGVAWQELGHAPVGYSTVVGAVGKYKYGSPFIEAVLWGDETRLSSIRPKP